MHVYIRLNDCIEKPQLLRSFQSGFRRKYSCNIAVAHLRNSWLTAMNKSEVSGVVFLDLLQKAFDLGHDILLKKPIIVLKKIKKIKILITGYSVSYSMALFSVKSQ